jgi:imidazolonepropionase-like amidohydrolase
MGNLYITADHLVDGISDEVIKNGRILVKNGTISALGDQAEAEANSETVSINLGDKYVCPGLIDAHVHLMWNGKPGAIEEARSFSTGQLVVQGLTNLKEALQAGITTVRDCGGFSDVLLPLKEGVSGGLIEGPSIILSGEPITTTGGHCYFIGIEAEGLIPVIQAVRTLHKKRVDFIKVMGTGGGTTPGSNVRRSQFSASELAAIARDAHRLEKRVTAHAHGIEGIRWLVDAGFDGIEHCSWLSSTAEGIHYDPRLASEMRKKGMVICRSTAGFERWPLEELNPDHQGWNLFEPFRRMAEDGVNLIAGTDAGIDHTDFKGLNLSLETMIGLGKMSHRQAFRSATSGSAELLGLDSVGSLKPGNTADIIVLEGNPEEDIRHLRNVLGVISRGKVRYIRKGVIKR